MRVHHCKRQKEIRETFIQKRDDYIHIETKGCLINVYPCLRKSDGRECTAIEVIPDDYLDRKFDFDAGASLTRVVDVT
jgi:hypothetical protein